ncbi:hypothetical protein [Neoroseomonas soli]|uniref:Uncharacterized protein n=1 Tax=Neoroseomonas soli TaxID=1081025 RepID=A0A9X9X2X6_9PROT|nr:hypothetical protein [Neoroseomonas soli]MBR0673755.1 hypothetical protein [Neoroseomonas soli]
MHTLQLLGVAAEAEGLRLRHEASAVARRAGWVAAATVFGVAALASAHVAAVTALEPRLGLPGAAGVVALADLVMAGVLLLACRRRRDPVVEEARALRRTALAAAASRSPLQEAAAAMMGSASAPILGAVAGQALASLIERRH